MLQGLMQVRTAINNVCASVSREFKPCSKRGPHLDVEEPDKLSELRGGRLALPSKGIDRQHTVHHSVHRHHSAETIISSMLPQQAHSMAAIAHSYGPV